MNDFETARQEFQPLGFSNRTIKALALNGIHTVAELRQLSKREFMRCLGIGESALSEAKAYLRIEEPKPKGVSDSRQVTVTFKPEILTAIDGWASEQGGMAGRAEAIRRLVELGLGVKKAKK